ncbi:MAG: peptidoglycan-binding domain-containing protein, partial [Sulfuricella sp.]
QGATGSEVTLAQKLLNNALSSYGATKLTVDGVFGAKMRAAVEKYQTLIGMYASGTVDADTWSALINGYVEVWSLEELYDGRIIIGNAAHIAKYRAAGRYTFTRDTDVITRSIDRSIDGAYSRIGVKYKSGDAEYYKYATIATWPGWSVPSHRTYYITAPSGATATQARDLANATAVAMQYVGVGEQVVGPIRPQLLVGDIAQISDDGGLTATVTGIITDITHRMGSTGYWTSFYTDSGGSIMEVDVDTVPTEATKPHPWVGRKQKISDAVAQIAKKVRKASALQSIE